MKLSFVTMVPKLRKLSKDDEVTLISRAQNQKTHQCDLGIKTKKNKVKEEKTSLNIKAIPTKFWKRIELY